MIKPKSLINEYTLIWSEDPALSLPEDPTERVTALRVARETGRWEKLILVGQQPTLFHVRPISGTALAWLISEANRRQWSELELAQMSLRLALSKIDNFGSHVVRHEVVEGHRAATSATLDALYEIGGDPGRALVMELGLIVFNHAREGISPNC